MGKIRRLAIANRGEVAVRIIRACQDMGVETILLHSVADIDTLAYRLADERIAIGAAPAAESYLNIEHNIDAAKAAGADAIHPGFGFLSENADFAEACERARIVFVGPSPEAIRLFGDKISAKRLVVEAGVPIISGYDGEDQSDERLMAEIERIGLPCIVKAAGGGGGRGLRVVSEMASAKAAIDSARRESKAAFNSEKLFIEKYLDHAKHIEFQIFGDSSGRVHCLFDRECSVQRRHQKIIEEAPAANLPQELRNKMAEAAVRIGTRAKYRGAGTVEFLVQDGDFYFMEMNTRLQVEHPVTEEVLGIDLVKAQILTAEGSSVLWSSDDLSTRGHAIECRIYAEDSDHGGIPSTGKLQYLSWPHGPGRRFECGFESGDVVTSFYDSMIAKVIVWDESRARALAKMRETLKECVVFGVKTNIPYLKQILKHAEFVEGTMTTRFIGEHFKNGMLPREWPDDLDQIVKIVVGGAYNPLSPWSLDVRSKGSSFSVGIGAESKGEPTVEWRFETDRRVHRVRYLQSYGDLWVHLDGETYFVDLKARQKASRQKRSDLQGQNAKANMIVAPMPGKVTKVNVQKGDRVSPEQVLVVIEAMKMEYNLTAHEAGHVIAVEAIEGAQVELDQVLVKLDNENS